MLVQSLKRIAPDQYYYSPNQFHITVLTLFSATENFAPFFEKIPEYSKVFSSVLANKESFQITFKGITASRSAVMVQGFTQNAKLNQLRDQLREALQKRGLDEGLDTRYRMTTAHSTIMRFQTQPKNLQVLLDTLADFREYDFGQTSIKTLQWVKNDWYMSPENIDVLEEYQLRLTLQNY
jgi:2'-5' RNA ligase